MKRVLILLVAFILSPVFAQELPDPTRPPITSSESVSGINETGSAISQASGIPDVTVSAIFYSEEKRFAIINSILLFEGEMWNNILLTKINKDSIELENGDFKRVVKVFNADVVEESAYVY